MKNSGLAFYILLISVCCSSPQKEDKAKIAGLEKSLLLKECKKQFEKDYSKLEQEALNKQIDSLHSVIKQKETEILNLKKQLNQRK